MARYTYDPIQQGFQDLQGAFSQIGAIKQREELFKLQKKQMEVEAESARMQREALERGSQGLQQAFSRPLEDPQQLQGPPTPDGQVPMSEGYDEQDRLAAMLGAGVDLSMGGNALGNDIVRSIIFPDPSKDKQKLLADIEKTRADTELVNARVLGERIANEQSKLNLANSTDFVESKGAIAQMIQSQAEEAKDAGERNRLKMAALAIDGSPDGAALATTLEKQFPNVRGASSAIEGLLRQGLDPVAAYKTLERIDFQNQKALQKSSGGGTGTGKPKQRDFGNDREAWAAILFDGKAFADLTAEEKKQANDRYIEQHLNLQKQKVGELPLSSENQNQVATYDYIVDLAERAASLATPELVGQLNAPLQKLKQKFGKADPQFTQLSNTLDELVDVIARDRTGAAIGAGEQKFYRELLGSVMTNPATLGTQLATLIERTERQRNGIIDLATTSAGDLRSRYGVDEPREPKAEVTVGQPTVVEEDTPEQAIPPVEPSGRTLEPMTPEQMKEGESLLKQYGIQF